MLPKLNHEEVVLALLGVAPDSAIRGTMNLVKQIFLLEKEVLPTIGVIAQTFRFFPWNQGPYSKELAEAINRLALRGFLQVAGEETAEGERRVFRLTPEGFREATDVLTRLDSAQADVLRSKRHAWDALGVNGILKLVYMRYPDYTVRSTIRDRVLGG